MTPIPELRRRRTDDDLAEELPVQIGISGAPDMVLVMADSNHLALLKTSPEAWNRWRKQNPDILPDLRYGDLRNSEP